MPFARRNEERRYAQRLAVYIGEFFDGDAVPPVFLYLLPSLYSYHRL